MGVGATFTRSATAAVGAVLAILLTWRAATAQTVPDPDAAPRDPHSVLTLQLENDLFAGTDRYYTNGLRLTWVSPSEPPRVFGPVERFAAPFLGDGAQLRWGLSAGQNIYTPQDTDAQDPDPHDRPYAAWLYGAATLAAYTDTQLNRIELQVGVVGPWAQGEEVQNNVHDLIEDRPARGWDYQLKNEPGVLLLLDRAWRARKVLSVGDDFGVDASPYVTAALGNINTSAAAGLSLRLGQSLDADFGAPRIRPTLGGSAFFDKRDGFGWYLFAGVEGRAVAHDIFLDGNTFRSSRSVDKKYFVGDFQAGASVFWGSTRLTYTFAMRTPEFDGQNGYARFGALSLSFSF